MLIWKFAYSPLASFGTKGTTLQVVLPNVSSFSSRWIVKHMKRARGSEKGFVFAIFPRGFSKNTNTKKTSCS